MIKNIFYSLLVTTSFFVVMNFANAGVSGTTVYVDSAAVGTGDGSSLVNAFTTIQAAIDDAATVDGDIIRIADGTYTITNTIEVTKSLTLQGTSQTGTIINASGATGSFGKFGIHSSKSNITFNDFTLTAPTGTQGRGFKIEGTTANTSGAAQDGARSANLAINRVTVNGDGGTASRTGIDINGVNGVTLTDVTSNNNGGNGISLTDSSNVSMTNITTSGNKWGGVALYTLGQYYPGGISGIIITGQNSSETNPLYNQNEGTFNGGNPFATTGVSAPQFTYKGVSTALPGYVLYNEDLAELYTALGASSSAITITNVSSGNTVIAPGQTIQSRIDAATAGATIVVPAGSYTENLTVNKALTLLGANSGIDAVSGTRGAESVITGRILVTASDVKVDGLKITNPTYSTASSIHGIQVFGNGPTISNIVLSNNIISEINNSTTKGAYGIMVQADVSGVTIEKNKIDTITSAGWARGIEITPSCGVVGIPQAVTISKNSVTNIIDTAGDDSYVVSVDWCSSVPRIADASQITLDKNIFDSTKVKNLDTVHSLLIAKNWFGAVTPDFSSATGSVIFSPWCLVDSCVSIWSQPGSGPSPSPASGGSGSVSTTTATSTATTTATSTTILQQTSTTTEQVLGASTFNFTRNLSFGMRGNDVSELQKILIAKGYLKLKTGQPTGWFGPLTRAALIKWQLENKIRAEGYFGPISRNILNPKN
jgi:hypothetical protein